MYRHVKEKLVKWEIWQMKINEKKQSYSPGEAARYKNQAYRYASHT